MAAGLCNTESAAADSATPAARLAAGGFTERPAAKPTHLGSAANAAVRPAADADADAGIGDTGDGGDTRDGSDTGDVGDVGTADGLAGRFGPGPVDDVRIGDATACPEAGGRAAADWAGAEAGDSPRAARSTRLRRPPPRSTSRGQTPSSTT
ncbi:hypothetical protein [Candidimonas humi]|uniref:Uncharacterized protein n=1 Tax=Candidimonas humi TaxID=683355 RepID=A0ABV8NTY0_9BURK|nr:hypothetical protein [Candidimonas humi]